MLTALCAAFPAGAVGSLTAAGYRRAPAAGLALHTELVEDEHSLLIFLEQNLLFQEQNSSQKKLQICLA